MPTSTASRGAGRARRARLGRDGRRAPSPLVEWPERARTALDRPIARRRPRARRPSRRRRARRAVIDGTRRLARRGSTAPARCAALLDARRLGRGAPRPHAGRRLDARLRAAGRSPTASTAILMISPPPRRTARRSARQALQRHRQARRERPRLRRRSTAACAAHGFSRAANPTARTSTPASSSSRISAPSRVVDADGPIPERYAEAARLLAELHATRPAGRPAASRDGIDHALPPYDLEALLIEVELLLDWYLPARRGRDGRRARRAAEFVPALARGARPRSLAGAADLDAARLPFAEPDLAARARGPRSASASSTSRTRCSATRPTTSPRSCRMRASTCRPSSSCSCSASTRASAGAARSRLRHRRPSRAPTRSWAPSAPPRSSASSPGSTGATASRDYLAPPAAHRGLPRPQPRPSGAGAPAPLVRRASAGTSSRRPAASRPSERPTRAAMHAAGAGAPATARTPDRATPSPTRPPITRAMVARGRASARACGRSPTRCPKPLVRVGGPRAHRPCPRPVGRGRHRPGRRQRPLPRRPDRGASRGAAADRAVIAISDERDALLETGGGVKQGPAAARRRTVRRAQLRFALDRGAALEPRRA